MLNAFLFHPAGAALLGRVNFRQETPLDFVIRIPAPKAVKHLIAAGALKSQGWPTYADGGKGQDEHNTLTLIGQEFFMTRFNRFPNSPMSMQVGHVNSWDKRTGKYNVTLKTGRDTPPEHLQLSPSEVQLKLRGDLGAFLRTYCTSAAQHHLERSKEIQTRHASGMSLLQACDGQQWLADTIRCGSFINMKRFPTIPFLPGAHHGYPLPAARQEGVL